MTSDFFKKFYWQKPEPLPDIIDHKIKIEPSYFQRADGGIEFRSISVVANPEEGCEFGNRILMRNVIDAADGQIKQLRLGTKLAAALDELIEQGRREQEREQLLAAQYEKAQRFKYMKMLVRTRSRK